MHRETDHELDALLPHRPPMRLIVALLERAAYRVAARARIPRLFPLAGQNEVTSLVAVELGAQATALLASPSSPNAATPRGFLVGIRSASFHRPTLPLEVDLQVTASSAGSAGPLSFFRITVARESTPERLLAEAQLGVFVDIDRDRDRIKSRA